MQRVDCEHPPVPSGDSRTLCPSEEWLAPRVEGCLAWFFPYSSFGKRNHAAEFCASSSTFDSEMPSQMHILN